MSGEISGKCLPLVVNGTLQVCRRRWLQSSSLVHFCTHDEHLTKTSSLMVPLGPFYRNRSDFSVFYCVL